MDGIQRSSEDHFNYYSQCLECIATQAAANLIPPQQLVIHLWAYVSIQTDSTPENHHDRRHDHRIGPTMTNRVNSIKHSHITHTQFGQVAATRLGHQPLQKAHSPKRIVRPKRFSVELISLISGSLKAK